jgi:hypothetical protein
MEVSTPDTPQMNQMSGLSGLANLIQKKHPGYTRKEAFELIKSVRNQNGGKLVGLKMKRFFKIAKDIGRRNITKMREKKNQEGSEGLKLKQTCPFCFKIFIEMFSRDRHIRIMHSKHPAKRVRKPGRALECSKCSRTFYDEANLKRHLRIHGENPLGFRCNICENKFTRKDNLYRHRERVHNLVYINIDAIQPDAQQSSFQCKMCRADFGDSKYAMVNHIVGQVCKKRDDSITVNDEGRLECDLCDKTYVGISNLRRHINQNHSSQREKHTCDKCNKAYADLSSLKRHIASNHGSGKHVCESCGVEFTRRTSLVRHLKVLHKV